ncbi:MAG TPA: 5'-nucleotidase, lipoprotein e(P4) family [Pyrinomonadaceae bacterium]|jgi:5'-nucleotidase (lipoprotein e(P4) family)
MKSIRKSRGLRGAGLIAALVLSAYSGAAFFGQTAAQLQTAAAAADTEYLTGATLWVQTGGEYRALAYQSYNLARMRFDLDLKNAPKKSKRPRAVVVDIDETVMDNSRYQASEVLKHKGYNADDFTDWCMRKEAGAVPGALEFLKYASAKGARIFYVSNRKQTERACTSENLKKLGFPDVSDETVLLRDETSGKEKRRQMIAEKYRIVLLCGDNLNDFTNVFEKKPIAERNARVDQMREEFGSRFIVIPNPMYGDWENAIYDYKNLPDTEKAAKRRETLRGF